jgi:heme exporter protein B
MGHIAKVITLVKIEILLDIKKPSVWVSAILQLATTALLSMLALPRMLSSVWNTLFWITLILGSIQAVSKNFNLVSKGRWIYWNQLASPSHILWGKIVYGWFHMVILTLCNAMAFAWFLGMPVEHPGVYLLILLLVSAGISALFTFIGAITSKIESAQILAPVLSLPVILPLLLIGIKASLKTLNPVLVNSVYQDLYLLGALDLLILVLTGVLFQSMWND